MGVINFGAGWDPERTWCLSSHLLVALRWHGSLQKVSFSVLLHRVQKILMVSDVYIQSGE